MDDDTKDMIIVLLLAAKPSLHDENELSAFLFSHVGAKPLIHPIRPDEPSDTLRETLTFLEARGLLDHYKLNRRYLLAQARAAKSSAATATTKKTNRGRPPGTGRFKDTATFRRELEKIMTQSRRRPGINQTAKNLQISSKTLRNWYKASGLISNGKASHAEALRCFWHPTPKTANNSN